MLWLISRNPGFSFNTFAGVVWKDQSLLSLGSRLLYLPLNICST